jgi:hypothetical protein
MRTALRCLVLMPVLLFSVRAMAVDDADSVKHWLPICKALISPAQNTDVKGAYLAGECVGMIEATAFVQQEGQPGGLPFLACLPDPGVSTHELVTKVLQWIEHEPDIGNQNFIVATQLALAVTYPCPATPKQK